MKKILVIYYSQTGQLTDITKSLLSPQAASPDISLTFHEIKPVVPYPFPWTALQFFDAFPESVLGTPCALQPVGFDASERFDLVVLACQVWYLSPSIPVNSFLQSPEAAKVLKDTPVVTIIGCRNMWIMAQEKIKQQLARLGSRVAGNIVFTDKAPNLVSVITISAWLIGGKREGFLGIFPRSGVPEKEVRASSKFGKIILKSLLNNTLSTLQQELNLHGAVEIQPNLMVLEKRGAKSFKIWANFIKAKGGPGSPERRARVRLFATCLPTAILLLSPITTLSTYLVLQLGKKKIKKDIEYFSQNTLQN